MTMAQEWADRAVVGCWGFRIPQTDGTIESPLSLGPDGRTARQSRARTFHS